MNESNLDLGETAEVGLIVQPSDTAEAVLVSSEDRFPAVFATARMVALMELAAARVLKSHLEDGQMSVGVSVNVNHTAATPVGAEVRAKATYLGREGKFFKFKVEAFDNAGLIGQGEHVRAIVSTERLLTGAAKRKP
jgi:predicted thioesterase